VSIATKKHISPRILWLGSFGAFCVVSAARAVSFLDNSFRIDLEVAYVVVILLLTQMDVYWSFTAAI